MTYRAVCTACGHAGPSMAHTPGSVVIEIILWLVFLLPGIIYSLWRRAGVRDVCESCGRDTVIPAGSPKAKALLAERGGWSQVDETKYAQTVGKVADGWFSVVLTGSFTAVCFAAELPVMGIIGSIGVALSVARWISNQRGMQKDLRDKAVLGR